MEISVAILAVTGLALTLTPQTPKSDAVGDARGTTRLGAAPMLPQTAVRQKDQPTAKLGAKAIRPLVWTANGRSADGSTVSLVISNPAQNGKGDPEAAVLIVEARLQSLPASGSRIDDDRSGADPSRVRVLSMRVKCDRVFDRTTSDFSTWYEDMNPDLLASADDPADQAYYESPTREYVVGADAPAYFQSRILTRVRLTRAEARALSGRLGPRISITIDTRAGQLMATFAEDRSAPVEPSATLRTSRGAAIAPSSQPAQSVPRFD